MYKYLTALCVLTLPALAEDPTIDSVKAVQTGSGWRFDVTISHPDTGWDHYADGWDVRTTDGTSLGLRVLHHPHVNEQPFTRSISGIDIPAGIDRVMIYSRCNETGWSDDGTEVILTE
ncbi:hypothetical protein [Parasulfitobacter algicola]|uniref:Secreted protein n=1 Tax=Parasulfitobacter algicola TaxID=2614809 RepID=A0ABX2IMW6_9RHOB|nr:hypothetical protein [Sulfitobacter algicola]NSX53880.1 hypothetical protein [Sulfitobacter algicola]